MIKLPQIIEIDGVTEIVILTTYFKSAHDIRYTVENEVSNNEITGKTTWYDSDVNPIDQPISNDERDLLFEMINHKLATDHIETNKYINQ